MLLENKVAVVYGAGGAIGGAVARAFAAEGARLFLAGRTRAKLERVAESLASASAGAGSGAGARACAEVEIAALDALDPDAVDQHADAVAARAGSIDISFNAISHDVVQGTPMVEMAPEDYIRPVAIAVRTMFLTTRAAARHMKSQGSGVILVFGGAADPPRGFHLGGLQTAFHAQEAMRRQLSVELGEYGIRVVTLKTSGVPDSIPESFGARREQIADGVRAASLLGRAATLEDVGRAAAFAASDHGRTMTAATINLSCGTFMD